MTKKELDDLQPNDLLLWTGDVWKGIVQVVGITRGWNTETCIRTITLWDSIGVTPGNEIKFWPGQYPEHLEKLFLIKLEKDIQISHSLETQATPKQTRLEKVLEDD